ncbi:MAG: radical SAM family heme chaperone HemW [Flavobacteriales bacterium]
MAGIYFHVPFCRKKCTYCDFHFSTTFSGYRTPLLELMSREFNQRLNELNDPVETIYFGGGSPGLLTPTELDLLLKEPIRIAGNQLKELTLEANPEDVTKANLSAWKSLGINRISLGIQSLNTSILSWMNRNHTVAQSLNALDQLAAYDFSLSIDLIYGIPNQEINDLLGVIELLDLYHIEHFSAYALTKEPNTALARWIKQGKNAEIDDDQQITHYYTVQKELKQRGFLQYEVSNYSKNKQQAKHNANYWAGKPYLGIGPGAHSFDGVNTRRWNVPNNQRYLKQEDWFDVELLSADNLWNECWLTGLRTIHGVSLNKLQSLGGLTLNEKTILNKLISDRLLRLDKQHYILTNDGFLAADRLASMLFRI